MLSVVEHLQQRAATHPNQVALHIPSKSVNPNRSTPHRAVTFAELHADMLALSAGLSKLGITPGMRVALMVPPGLDFFALTFALFHVGAVPVFIDPGMGMKNVKACLAHAEPEVFIGSAKANFARRVFGWAKPSLRITVNSGRRRFFCDASTAELRSNVSPRRKPGILSLSDAIRIDTGFSKDPRLAPWANDSLAAILFTSGSTGLAKGVEYTHAIFAAQIESLKATYQFTPGEIDLCTFPLFALFGAALGMTCVIPDMDASRPATVDPAKIRSQLRQFRPTNLFASPAVLKRLANEPDADAVDYSSLKRVLSAGAPATAAVLEAFAKLLPTGVTIFTPYGATECLPVANVSSAEILSETRVLTEQGKGVCIGRPVDGMAVSIIPISDEPLTALPAELPTGEIGEFLVRGPVVTPRYFRNAKATELAKIVVDGAIYHRMGDVGYRDDRGRLWFCGRKSHRVVTPNGTLFTDMVEPVFNTFFAANLRPLPYPQIRDKHAQYRTALVDVVRDGIHYPVLCIEGENVPPLYSAFLTCDQERGGIPIAAFLDYPTTFPVDVRHNSKIFREKLAAWADKQLGPRWKGGPA